MCRLVTNDELARTALHHVRLLDVVLQSVVAFALAKPIEASHYREAFKVIFIYALVELFEGNDALAVLKRQQEVVSGANANWFELAGGEVNLFEWKLDEYQLAEGRLTSAGKREERGEIVVENDRLELLLAIAELLHELVGLVQSKFQIVFTWLSNLKKHKIFK